MIWFIRYFKPIQTVGMEKLDLMTQLDEFSWFLNGAR